ncbi:MAG: hypothetical protein PVS3B2_17990 [Candidatus Dormibacteraceae bacterium]
MLVMMFVISMAVFGFAGLWVGWWLSADFLSTDRSARTEYVAPANARRGMPQVLAARQNIRLAR